MIYSNTFFSEKVAVLKTAIGRAELIIIGAGSGLSAAAGLRYDDPVVFNTLFPAYHEHYGLQTINEASFCQFQTLEEQHAFWARLISAIRCEFPAGKPYLDLHRIIGGKPHFILTTNTDGQFHKSGFNPDVICTPQGDYAFFQCSRSCNDSIYHNEQMIMTMLLNIMPDEFSVPAEHIPRCPHCNSPLIPNIRNSDVFVEKPWIIKYSELNSLINTNRGKNILLLELGVGINAPGIIRYPFELLTLQRKNTNLVRINLNTNNLTLLKNAENAAIIQADIRTILAELAERLL